MLQQLINYFSHSLQLVAYSLSQKKILRVIVKHLQIEMILFRNYSFKYLQAKQSMINIAN
jgi:hypothetical protein